MNSCYVFETYGLQRKDSIKNYVIFENVITDSIVDVGVSVQVKNSAGGVLNLRTESKKGDVISKCELPTAGDSKWNDVKCSNLPKLKGVQDFYLTAEGLGSETLVGNIKFDKADTSSVAIPGSNRVARKIDVPVHKGYHDLKGRRFDKQIPYRVMF